MPGFASHSRSPRPISALNDVETFTLQDGSQDAADNGVVVRDNDVHRTRILRHRRPAFCCPDDPARAYPGDRPSTTLLLDDLDARTLGALIAYHEHRVFVNGVLLGINSFDQFGVELGKEMAKAAQKGEGDFDPSTTDLIKRAFG